MQFGQVVFLSILKLFSHRHQNEKQNKNANRDERRTIMGKTKRTAKVNIGNNNKMAD